MTAVATIEVRLALHVLRPFVGEQRLLTEYWKAATIEPRIRDLIADFLKTRPDAG